MPQLAHRMGRAKPSAIMAVAEKAKALKAAGRDIVSFSIGVPNFLPGPHVYAAAREALEKDSGQYGSNRGSDALLDAFLAHLKGVGLEGYTRANCSTGIGAKHVLFNLAEALLDEGDTIAYAVPYWTTYADIADISNAKRLELPCPASQNYKLTPAQLDAALAQKPKIFLFNNPNNPTGMVYTRAEIEALAAVIARHPDTWIVCDDIYNRMVFDSIGYHNFLHSQPSLRDRLVFVDSLSKTYGMPGWRVGFMVGPESVAKAVTTLNSNHITNIPEVVTAAAIAALTGPQEPLQAMLADYAARRDWLMPALTAAGFTYGHPGGAFYIYTNISSTGMPAPEFCERLLRETGVMLFPGTMFGDDSTDYIRISYLQPLPMIQEAMRRITAFAQSVRVAA